MAIYRIFKTRLHRVWQTMRELDAPLDTVVAVTLVTGAPPMPGIEVSRALDGTNRMILTIATDSEEVRSWHFRPFKLTVGKYLRRLGVKTVPDQAFLHAVWLRAGRGDQVVGMPLPLIDDVPAFARSRGAYHFVSDPIAATIALVVHDLRYVIDSVPAARLQGELIDAVRQVEHTSGCAWRTLWSEVMRTLQSANRGPERLGLDLPLVLLGALGDRAAVVKPVAKKESLSISIQADRMVATIVRAETAVLDEVIDALVAQGIAPQTIQMTAIEAALARKASLDGMVVALGQPPVKGAGPVIERTTALDAVRDSEGMRDAQARLMVRKGQVFAAVTFRDPGRAGVDVTGRVLPAPPGPLPPISVGDGVALRDATLFIANHDGIPEIDGFQVTLRKALIIDGNVNLATGNVHFVGPVTINGTIEAGATVEVHGDLKVTGMIEAAFVKVGGNLAVTGGIVTNEHGRLRVTGDLTADFIENSTVSCDGSVHVARTIMASDVSAAGRIVLTRPDSVVAGGELVAGSEIRCGNLGRPSGPPTVVQVGVDPKAARRLGRHRHRRGLVAAYLDAKKLLKRELGRKKAAQKAKRHQQAEASLPERIARAEALILRLDRLLAEAELAIRFDPDAKIVVTGTLSANCSLVVAGAQIVAQEVAAVIVSAGRVKGSHFLPLPDA